ASGSLFVDHFPPMPASSGSSALSGLATGPPAEHLRYSSEGINSSTSCSAPKRPGGSSSWELGPKPASSSWEQPLQQVLRKDRRRDGTIDEDIEARVQKVRADFNSG
ncbi:unnamed protein product, partial [Amoebophrya sp. A25]